MNNRNKQDKIPKAALKINVKLGLKFQSTLAIIPAGKTAKLIQV